MLCLTDDEEEAAAARIVGVDHRSTDVQADVMQLANNLHAQVKHSAPAADRVRHVAQDHEGGEEFEGVYQHLDRFHVRADFRGECLRLLLRRRRS